MAQSRIGRRGEGFDLGCPGHIATHGLDVGARGRQFGGRLVQAALIPVGENEARAFPGECIRQRPSNAGSRARDDSGLSLKTCDCHNRAGDDFLTKRRVRVPRHRGAIAHGLGRRRQGR